MRELPEIRQDINRVDSAIRELFLLRMSLALEVAKTKAQSDDKIYKPDREAEIVEKRSAGMEELQLKVRFPSAGMIRARAVSISTVRFCVRRRKSSRSIPQKRLQSRKPCSIRGSGCVSGAGRACVFPSCEPQNVPTWEQVFQSVRDGKGRYRRCAGREHNRQHGQRSL